MSHRSVSAFRAKALIEISCLECVTRRPRPPRLTAANIRREGHCLVPRWHVLGTYKLGQWVSVQRYRRDLIPTKLRKRLDAIGFVWDWHEDAWEKGFSALTRFKAHEGALPRVRVAYSKEVQAWSVGDRTAQEQRQNTSEAQEAAEYDRFRLACAIAAICTRRSVKNGSGLPRCQTRTVTTPK